MSTNACPGSRQDPRARRTRDRLGDALVELVQEKPFDSITVQEVLDRAGVSRSAFYTHFRDKDDLFLSDAEDFFHAMASLLTRRAESSERIAPVREFFAHVAEVRRFFDALVASGRFHDHMDLGRECFARGIEQRLAALPRARGLGAAERTAMSHLFAGAMIALLLWWVRRESPESPEHMDELFHRMAWAGVAGESAMPRNAS